MTVYISNGYFCILCKIRYTQIITSYMFKLILSERYCNLVNKFLNQRYEIDLYISTDTDSILHIQ